MPSKLLLLAPYTTWMYPQHHKMLLNCTLWYVLSKVQSRRGKIWSPTHKSNPFYSWKKENNLIEMFFPRILKEFDSSGLCSTKVGGIIGQTADNCSIVRIPMSKAFSDIIACWSKNNLITYQKGKEILSNYSAKALIATRTNCELHHSTPLPYSTSRPVL